MSQRINQATGEPLWEVKDPVSHLTFSVAAKTAEAAACDAAEANPDWFAVLQWGGDDAEFADTVTVRVRAIGTHDEPIAVTVRASLECVVIDTEGVPF